MNRIKYQQGFTLLEMMVSLSIGLLLLLGLGSIYQVANQSNKDNEALSINAEASRRVFDRLSYDLRRAGFVDLYDSPVESFKKQTSGTLSAVNCPADSPVASGTQYNKILGNNQNAAMVTIYKRYLEQDPTKMKLNPAFLAPISAISCGSMRPVFGCDDSMESYPNIFTRAKCAGTGSDANSIEIAYQAAKASNSPLSVLPENAQDCAYHALFNVEQLKSANPTEKLKIKGTNNGFVVNRYFVDGGDFKCQGNVIAKDQNQSLNVTLVNGVEEMVLRYVATVPETDASKDLVQSNSGRVVTAYKTAAEIEGTELGWSGVVGVEVCLVIATDARGSSIADVQDKRPSCKRKVDDKDSFVDDKDKENKQVLYQRYIRTFSLPNSLYSPMKY